MAKRCACVEANVVSVIVAWWKWAGLGVSLPCLGESVVYGYLGLDNYGVQYSASACGKKKEKPTTLVFPNWMAQKRQKDFALSDEEAAFKSRIKKGAIKKRAKQKSRPELIWMEGVKGNGFLWNGKRQGKWIGVCQRVWYLDKETHLLLLKRRQKMRIKHDNTCTYKAKNSPPPWISMNFASSFLMQIRENPTFSNRRQRGIN